MKRWAAVTVLLYVAILALLALPLGVVAFDKFLDFDLESAFDLWSNPGLWIWLAFAGLAQAALLVVPVRAQSKRPLTRKAIIWPVLAGLAMLLLMVAGMSLVAWETVLRIHDATDSSFEAKVIIICASFLVLALIWLSWAILFGFYCGRNEPRTVVSRLVRMLLAGSILELLVSVPAHVYARSKDDCCGGMGTVWGLAAGISVMLFAFGPTVFVLFARRVRSIRPNAPAKDPEGGGDKSC